MLSDEVIEKVTERLVNRIEQGNEYVLEQIGKKIKEVGKLSSSQAQKLSQVFKYGGDYNKIVKKLSEISKLNVKDVQKIIEEVAKSELDFAKQFYDYRNKKFIPYKDNLALQRQVEAVANLTSKEYMNLARTKALGYSVRDNEGNLVFKGLKKVYDEAIDKAILSVVEGKSTFDEQLYRLIKDIGKSGLKTLDYKNGRTLRLDSAIRMHMEDAIRQIHNETQEQIGKEIGSDGVEISVHLNPAPDHEEVQGKQFSNKRPSKNKMSEFEKFQNDTDCYSYDGTFFPSEYNGQDRRSISQYNCKHKIFVIVLGVSKPLYTDEQLKEIIRKNNEGFEFDGKHYTNYEGTQLQRQIELEVRKQKDIQIMARASGKDELIRESQNNISILTRKYKELSKISGLPTKMDRMRVSDYRKVALRGIEKPKVDILPMSMTNNGPSSIQKSQLNEVVDGRLYNTSKIFKASKEYLDLSNNENINIYNGSGKLNITINERSNIKKAYYSRYKHKVNTTSVIEGSIKPQKTLWHEMGHALDNYKGGDIYVSNSAEMRMAMNDYYSNNKTIPKNVEDYFNNLKEKIYDEFKEKNNYDYYYNNYIDIKREQGSSEYNLGVYKDRWDNDREDYARMVKNDYERQMRKYYSDKTRQDMNYAQLSNLSDMFSAISKGKYNDFCGSWGYHTAKYFNSEVELPTTELFANFVSLKMTGCKEHLDFFKKQAPDIYRELEKIYKQVGDDLNAR